MGAESLADDPQLAFDGSFGYPKPDGDLARREPFQAGDGDRPQHWVAQAGQGLR
jgi:hypothetical protein